MFTRDLSDNPLVLCDWELISFYHLQTDKGAWGNTNTDKEATLIIVSCLCSGRVYKVNTVIIAGISVSWLANKKRRFTGNSPQWFIWLFYVVLQRTAKKCNVTRCITHAQNQWTAHWLLSQVTYIATCIIQVEKHCCACYHPHRKLKQHLAKSTAQVYNTGGDTCDNAVQLMLSGVFFCTHLAI